MTSPRGGFIEHRWPLNGDVKGVFVVGLTKYSPTIAPKLLDEDEIGEAGSGHGDTVGC